jgi:hypothetical protein
VSEANRVVQIGIVLDGGRVLGDALDPSSVQPGLHRLKLFGGGLAEQHELAPRHFDLADVKAAQLRDHVVDRQAVIGVGADAQVQFGGGGASRATLRATSSTASTSVLPKKA